MVHQLGEIPDSVKSKHYFPLFRHLWPCFRELGWEIWNDGTHRLSSMVYELMKERLNESIMVTRNVVQHKISAEDAQRTFCYTIMPSIVLSRSDLQIGTMKLLYGNSTSCAFNIIDDENSNLLFTLNSHIEEGIPSDWFILNQSDDVMDRRHLKLGAKLKEIPARTKYFTEGGLKIINVLRDVRNERMPIYSLSPFIGAMSWLSVAVNIVMDSSCYESHGLFWDGVNAKAHYGLPDFGCCFTPFPPLFRTLFRMSRTDYISKMSGLVSGHDLYLLAVNEKPLNWIKDEMPELFKIGIVDQWDLEGVPLPKMSIASTGPSKQQMAEAQKVQEIGDDQLNKYWSWPPGNRIKLENLGFSTVEEVYKGIHLDVNNETENDYVVKPDDIKSIGIGRATKFLK